MLDPNTYEGIKEFVREQYQIDLNRYKEKQMLRRLNSWLKRSRVGSWPDYFGLVMSDPEEYEKFRNYLTINVTSFFRDPDRWKLIENEVLPDLLERFSTGFNSPGLSAWSAGCSIGAEPYTLAILLDRLAPGKKHQILATDFDRGALKIARAGGPYSADDLKNISPADQEKYFSGDEKQIFIRSRLQNQIRFQEQDLLSDRFESGFHLIVCRNVVIYFTREIKDVLYQNFYRALVPGGVLFLGGTEIIPQARSLGYQSLGGSVYMKAPNLEGDSV